MSDQSLVKEALLAVHDSIGEQFRERAAFWHFSKFNIGDQGHMLARMALADIVGEDIAKDVDEKLLTMIIIACYDIRSGIAT